MNTSTPQSRFGWPQAITVIAVLFIAVVFAFGVRFLDYWKPEIIVNESTVIQTSLSELKRKAKLVVLSAKVAVLVEARNDKKYELGPFTVPAGTTTVLVRAQDNRVQYVIPLEAVSESNCRYEAALNRLTVRLPHPIVDEEIVELAQNPEVKIDVGWARMGIQSGRHLLEKAKGAIRQSVLHEATNPVYHGASRDAGREAAMKLLEPSIARIPGNVTVSIEFDEAPPQIPKPDLIVE